MYTKMPQGLYVGTFFSKTFSISVGTSASSFCTTKLISNFKCRHLGLHIHLALYATPEWPGWAKFRLLNLLVSLKIVEARLLFFTRYKFCLHHFKKMGWATFWSISSHTHLAQRCWIKLISIFNVQRVKTFWKTQTILKVPTYEFQKILPRNKLVT
jgi:hypothetical protein